MKKIGFIIFCFLLCSFMSAPLNAYAKETVGSRYLTEGYTSEGIHYTIYEVPTSASPTMRLQGVATQQYVVRQIHFDGCITPSETWFFAEQINEHIYTGTLLLDNYQVIANTTIATYKGYLNLVN